MERRTWIFPIKQRTDSSMFEQTEIEMKNVQ